jgi:hypothetical protein
MNKVNVAGVITVEAALRVDAFPIESSPVREPFIPSCSNRCVPAPGLC